MKTVRFKPYFDKMTLIIWVPTLLLLVGGTVISCFAPLSLIVMVPTDLLALYFLVSPFFGYVELRRETVFIKFGIFAKREISYAKIRGVEKVRRVYADSMMSLKGAIEHVNIKYGSFDVVSVSVMTNDGLISELNERIAAGGRE